MSSRVSTPTLFRFALARRAISWGSSRGEVARHACLVRGVLVALAAAVFVVAGCGGTSVAKSSHEHGLPLSALVLSLADLPSGYQQDYSHAHGPDSGGTPAQQANIRHNRLRGWEAEFTSTGAALRTIVVQSTISEWRTPASAHRAIVLGFAELGRHGGVRLSLRDGQGADSALYRYDSKGARVFLLVWRRGSMLVSVGVGGLTGIADPALAVSLAQRQDHRLR